MGGANYIRKCFEREREYNHVPKFSSRLTFLNMASDTFAGRLKKSDRKLYS